MTEQNRIDAIAEIVKKHARADILTVAEPELDGACQIIAVSTGAGVELKSIKKFTDEWREAPERRSGTSDLTDLASFVEITNRFKDGHSAIFADCSRAAPSMTAVFDYHGPTDGGAPRFGGHRACYRFPVSDEWKLWVGQDGPDHAMDQSEFASFIEDHIENIADPKGAVESAKAFAARFSVDFATPAKLIEVSRSFHVHVGAKTRHHLNPSTGEVSVAFESEHVETIAVPRAFLLSIPVFKHGDRFQICARLRYRTAGGATSWYYQLYRHDDAFDAVMKEAHAFAKDKTGLPLFLGTPEKS